MNILDAARSTVRNYPGGVEAMALRLQKQPGTLDRELRGAPGYKLGAVDAAEIGVLALEQGGEQAAAYFNAVAAAARGMLVLLPRGGEDLAPSAKDVAALMRECAEVVDAAADAEADGRWTLRELDGLERRWAVAVAAGQTLVRNARARYEADMQRHHAAVEAAR